MKWIIRIVMTLAYFSVLMGITMNVTLSVIGTVVAVGLALFYKRLETWFFASYGEDDEEE